MNYLQLVQEAMYRSGVRSAQPSTLVGAIDVTSDFKRYVNDVWRELQEESVNWFFRRKPDQTLAIVASTDSYAMPSGLETLNYRTCTIYTTAKQDETPVVWCPYEEWRMRRDTVETQESRPKIIAEMVSGTGTTMYLWPVPDQAYTLRFDGVYEVDELSADADTPGLNTAGGQTLPSKYHWVLVYGACLRWAEHHEDPEAVAKFTRLFKAQRTRLSEYQTGPVTVPMGALTGVGGERRTFY